jgi:hypothetical protein
VIDANNKFKKRKNGADTVEDLCVAEFDSIVAGLEDEDKNIEGYIRAAREVVEKFFVDTDESAAIDIYWSYIDESRDKTDPVVLL